MTAGGGPYVVKGERQKMFVMAMDPATSRFGCRRRIPTSRLPFRVLNALCVRSSGPAHSDAGGRGRPLHRC